MLTFYAPGGCVFGGGAFRRWLGPKGRALSDGISALTREAPGGSLVPSAVWRHSEKTAVCEPGRGGSPDARSGSPFIGLSSAFRIVRNKYLFEPPSPWCIFTAGWIGKTPINYQFVINAKSQAFISDLTRICILQDFWMTDINGLRNTGLKSSRF